MSIGVAWRFAELPDGELRGGDSGLGEQSRRGGLVGGHREGVAAADGRAGRAMLSLAGLWPLCSARTRKCGATAPQRASRARRCGLRG